MGNNNTIYQVDAFTDTPFKGNPAGVMLLDAFPTEEWMQQMAAEMNVSETAFVVPDNEGYAITYFSPTMEIPLCGHATLAAAHVMYEQGVVQLDVPIHFKAKGGALTVSYKAEVLEMVLPRYVLTKIGVPKHFKSLLGFEPIAMYEARGWAIAVAPHENAIASCIPDYGVLEENDLGKLMITAEAVTPNADFVVRCFAPVAGINEDPVTGSAHCALTPLWAERLGKTTLVSHQISKRGGILNVALKGEAVAIKGKAITVFKATLNF